MYKITYLPTGHIFELPEANAQELKEKYPFEYKIIEKNGKKYRDKFPKKNMEENIDNDSIFLKVVEQ